MAALELPPRLSFSSLLRRGGEERREGMEGKGGEEEGVDGRGGEGRGGEEEEGWDMIGSAKRQKETSV